MGFFSIYILSTLSCLIFVHCLASSQAIQLTSLHTHTALELPAEFTLNQSVLPPLSFSNQGLSVVSYSDPRSKIYLGSPYVLKLENGTLLASHDTFYYATGTHVFASHDNGLHWTFLTSVHDQYWSSLFLHDDGSIYLLGTNNNGPHAEVSIAQSVDDGLTWVRQRLMAPPQGCAFATGSVPVISSRNGYILRGMESWCGQLHWPASYRAHVLYARQDVDLMDPNSWYLTNPTAFEPKVMIPEWMPDPVVQGGFLEGNVVEAPNGSIKLLLRCLFSDSLNRQYTLEWACAFDVQGIGENDGARLRWRGLVPMPGGGNKFFIKKSQVSPTDGEARYLALSNPSIDRYGSNFDVRNKLVLLQSTDLFHWDVGQTLLTPSDGLEWDESIWQTGYHYASMDFDGDSNLLIIVRTAYDGANSYHNSNYITFKRVPSSPHGVVAPA